MSNIQFLKEKATEVRRDIIKMITEANSGHPGGSLSAADIVTALYFEIMNIDPKDPKKEDRDRFVLSKGHASPLLYSVLAERGYIAKESLKTFRKYGSKLQGHPDMNKVPGVEISTGSLGQGLSVANGMAISGKLYNKNYRVYALLGDGELQEGQNWEAAMTSAHYKLDNLSIFIDNNGLQIDGKISDVMEVAPIEDKFKAFGWNVINIDGHNFDEILAAVEEAKSVKGMPTAIVAKTIKGKGVSFMENVAGFHGQAPTKEQEGIALKELGE